MRDSRKRPVAAAVLAAFGLNFSCNLVAGTVIVDRCDDDSGGFGTTLRQAIDVANSGDLVDLSALNCSTITLAQGELAVFQSSLGLLGPFDHTLTIDAHGGSRAFHHYGAGFFALSYLSAVSGSTTGSGGCIVSGGTLYLLHSTLSSCAAGFGGGAAYAGTIKAMYADISDNSAYDRGGGLWAHDYLLLQHSDASGNHVEYGIDHQHGSGGAVLANDVTIQDSILRNNVATYYGGAAYASNNMQLTRTTISGNTALGGGGVYTQTLTTVVDSTIDNNSAGLRGGGIYSAYVDITGSTISTNSAFIGGGVLIIANNAIRNSTIVGNSGGGVIANSVTIISSIVANNAGGPAADVAVDPGGLTAYTSLIRASNDPSVSLTVDPRLGPLADHGGGRRTHAVTPGSPVIDLGSNPMKLQYDERGLPRTVGLRPDMGAYERQANDDQLFYGGFDSS